jgi:hypothetical protein
MPRHNPIQCPAQRNAIQLPLQKDAKRHVIGSACSLHLRKKPQALLCKRQGYRFRAFGTRDCRQP